MVFPSTELKEANIIAVNDLHVSISKPHCAAVQLHGAITMAADV